MIGTPSANGTNGRDAGGRFAKGNPGGPGNPHGADVSRLRAAMLSTVSADDLQRIIRVLIDKAVAGDVAAAKEVLDRVAGKPKATVEIDDRRPVGERAILQQINVILDRQPDLRRMLTGEHRELIGMPQDDNADHATDDPPAPPNGDADAE